MWRRAVNRAASTASMHRTNTPFPSLIVGKDSVQAVGSFAEAQAAYLRPDESVVEELAQALDKSRTGVVAHYYMDVELQGVLQAVQQQQQQQRISQELAPRIGIADSLKMGDLAVNMSRQHNLQAVACLGVDFMSESVAALMRRSDDTTPVYRAVPDPIGCSLAESAERDTYRAWLQQESSRAEHALHVVYINTSLETKAVSNSIVPTVTCTSSNVLQTLLTASAQLPDDLRILYGPDTYMGENLVTLLDSLVQSNDWDDAKIARDLHPSHTQDSLARLRDAIAVYPSGNCVVHHMFGASVVDRVRQDYADKGCFVTAHLEVPGEMFGIAMEKSLRDEGVVGSTSDILNFVSKKVEASAVAGESTRLRFVLGTEAGMITSIVQSVQRILNTTGNSGVECEIIFPVASEAVMGTDDPELSVVPGVGGGEGCSTAGGCATCPFMKMNDLDALLKVTEMVADAQSNEATLRRHLPPSRLEGKSLNGVPAVDVGTEPIMHMRDFMKHKRLPDGLVKKILQ